MTRTMVGGIAAGALALGVLAGALIPTVFRPAHHQMFGAGMGQMPMMGSGSMAGDGAMWQQHSGHHAGQGGAR